VKSTLLSRRTFILITILLAVALVACERPLQEEAPTATLEPDIVEPVETQAVEGGEPAGEPAGEAVPTLVPTVAAPAGETGEPAEGAAEEPEQPAPEGGEPAAPEGGAEEAPQPEPVEEPQPEPTAPPAPQEPAGEQVHTVQAGQNLFRIGLQYGCTVAELSAYNGIVNPDYITVGQQIRIPPNCGG
jgi:outer membrane biosynthesis protein TonB